MTFGTVPVAAGVIGIDLPLAVVALLEMAAKVGGAARFDITQGLELITPDLSHRTSPVRH